MANIPYQGPLPLPVVAGWHTSQPFPTVPFAMRAPTFSAGTSSGSITLLDSEMPPGTIDAAYSQTLTASGGTGPYTFSVTAGSLPAGLTLDSATGIISGTPTAAGTSTFTVTATDSTAATGSQSLSIVVATPSGGSANYGYFA